MIQQKHSPLPWSVDGYCAVFSGDRCVAGTANHWSDEEKNYGRTINQANAAFIVHACNVHYELVEALRRILDCQPGYINTVTLKAARAALAKAEASNDPE